MPARLRPAVRAVAAALALPAAASAQVTFHAAPSLFDALSSTTLEATFDGLGEGTIAGALTQGRVTFTPPGPFTLYIATPGGPAEPSFHPGVRPLTSDVLTATGNESIAMTFSGAAPTAFSMRVLLNGAGGAGVRVFDVGGAEIGGLVFQEFATVRFLGITSTIPIGRIQYDAVLGNIQDTGLDDVRVGTGVSAVPEPATLALVGGGLAAVLGAGARRRG